MLSSFVNAIAVALLAVAITLAAGQNLFDNETDTTTESPTTVETTTGPFTTTELPTSTAVPPTPAPPTPAPEPKKHKWQVTEKGSNITCILLEAEFTMVFVYLNATSKQNISDHKLYVPDNAVASGKCNKDLSNIVLKFYNDWELTLTFNRTDKKYSVSEVKLMYQIVNGTLFPDAMEENSTTDEDQKSIFSVNKENRYQCDNKEIIYNKAMKTPAGLKEISVKHLQVQAFRNSTSTDFSGPVSNCSADNVSQLVPIIVGATLAGLIVVVLIAYLIGRRRSRRGYESV